jgi:hypothetical protein
MIHKFRSAKLSQTGCQFHKTRSENVIILNYCTYFLDPRSVSMFTADHHALDSGQSLFSSRDDGYFNIVRLLYCLRGARVVERRDAYRVMAPELEGKKPLGRTRRRWQNNTKMYLTAVGWDGGGGLD